MCSCKNECCKNYKIGDHSFVNEEKVLYVFNDSSDNWFLRIEGLSFLLPIGVGPAPKVPDPDCFLKFTVNSIDNDEGLFGFVYIQPCKISVANMSDDVIYVGNEMISIADGENLTFWKEMYRIACASKCDCSIPQFPQPTP